MSPINKEQFFHNNQGEIDKGVDMEVRNNQKVDHRILDAIGDKAFLIDETQDDTQEHKSGRIVLTEEDESNFSQALGRFILGRKELQNKINAGAITPADSIAEEQRLLEVYKTEVKSIGTAV